MTFELTYSPLVTVIASMLVIAAAAFVVVRSLQLSARIRRSLMAVTALAALMTPSVPVATEEVSSSLEVYLAVDLTGSMAAEDYDGTSPRLSGVRQDIDELVTELAGARFSVVSYTSVTSRQLPLTTDTRAVRAFADTARQEITNYSAGSAIDRPVVDLAHMLREAEQRHPSNVRVLFLFTDGESTRGEGAPGETSQAESFATLAPLIDGGAVLGYGTEAGGKMREYDGTSATGAGTDAPFIKDPATGADAVSRLDAASLNKAAAALGVPYLHRTAPGSLAAVTANLNAEAMSHDGRREVTITERVLWPFMIALVGLTAWELFALAGQYRQVRRHD